MESIIRTGFDAMTGAGGSHLPPTPGQTPIGPPIGIRTIAEVGGVEATRIVLVRHGEANCNISGICGGPKGCTGLTERGVQQVSALHNRLERTGELLGTDVVVTSILPRAIQTAEILIPSLLLPAMTGARGADYQETLPHLVRDCDFCELHPGIADGMGWDEFTTKFGDPDWDSNPQTPIAPGGESWVGFVDRVFLAMERLAREYTGKLIVVATHAGVIEATLLSLLPVEGGHDGARLALRTHHASMTTWEFENEEWRLLDYNDSAHLLSLPDEIL